MEFDEIYRLARAAHAGEEFLSGIAETYKMDYEDFEHSEERVGWRENGRNVSQDMLRATTERVVEAVPEYQSMLKSMEVAQEDLEGYNTSRFVEGQKVQPDDLQQQFDQLIDSYRGLLEGIWNTGYRIHEHPELETDPIDMRYKQWRRQLRRQEAEDFEALGQMFD